MGHVEELVDHAQREAGTVRYRAAMDVTNPSLLHFFEQYEDAAAAEVHAESEPYRQFMSALPEFADGSIETVQFETDDVHVSEFTATDAANAVE